MSVALSVGRHIDGSQSFAEVGSYEERRGIREGTIDQEEGLTLIVQNTR